jgi:hypothetical protein
MVLDIYLPPFDYNARRRPARTKEMDAVIRVPASTVPAAVVAAPVVRLESKTHF